MLASPATGRRTSKNVALGPQLLSCETQRDLVFERASDLVNQRQNHRNRPPTEPEF